MKSGTLFLFSLLLMSIQFTMSPLETYLLYTKLYDKNIKYLKPIKT